MNFDEVLKNRHATRFFTRQQIKLQDIKEIISDAQKAPSWLNAQERKIFVATGETAKIIRKEFQERAEKNLIGVSDFTAVHRNEWSESAQKNMKN